MSTPERDPAHFGKFTNLGLRAPDIDAELAFLGVFGASNVTRSQRMHEGELVERVQVAIGTTRFAMFREGTYDKQLEALGVHPTGGISHAAFEVGSTARLIEAAARAGYAPLIPTFRVESSLSGRALITYFRSPNGVIVEAKEPLAE